MKNKIISESSERNFWLICDDSALLAKCKITEFQSSGPGGQKRNRKYSAIRLFHTPSNIEVIAVDSRSQNVNKFSALKKLRNQIAMNIRSEEPLSIDTFVISLRNPQYPRFLAVLFDALHHANFSVKDASDSLNLSTSKLVKLLHRDKDAWQKVNTERSKRNLSTLK